MCSFRKNPAFTEWTGGACTGSERSSPSPAAHGGSPRGGQPHNSVCAHSVDTELRSHPDGSRRFPTAFIGAVYVVSHVASLTIKSCQRGQLPARRGLSVGRVCICVTKTLVCKGPNCKDLIDRQHNSLNRNIFKKIQGLNQSFLLRRAV